MEVVGQEAARTVTVDVPEQMVAAATGLVEAFSTLLLMDRQLDAEELKAKQLGALLAVRAVREIRVAWRGAVTPLVHAYEAATGEKFPKGPDVGRITKEQAQLVDPLLVPGGSFLTVGSGLAARLVARLGVKGAALAIARVGGRARAGIVVALRVVGKVAKRGALPALVTTALAAGFEKCGKAVGLAVGLLAALKLAGSPMAKAALADALPVLLAIGAGILLLKKGRW